MDVLWVQKTSLFATIVDKNTYYGHITTVKSIYNKEPQPYRRKRTYCFVLCFYWSRLGNRKQILPLTQEEGAAPGRHTQCYPPWHRRTCHNPTWRGRKHSETTNCNSCALSLGTFSRTSLHVVVSECLLHSSCLRWRSEGAGGCHCWASSPRGRSPSSTCGCSRCRRCPVQCSPLWGLRGSRPHPAASSWSRRQKNN